MARPSLHRLFERELSGAARERWERAAELVASGVLPLEDQARAQGREPTPAELAPLCEQARASGLWNLFLTSSPLGPGLSNVEYAAFAEVMGYGLSAAEVFNCAPPDSGNMEILARFGTQEQRSRWLEPLMRGEIRSCFSMTERGAAGSDPGGVRTRAEVRGDEVRINGVKWFSSGLLDERCALIVLFALSDPDAPRRRRHSIVLVPSDTPGVRVGRSVPIHGYHHRAGHCEVAFDDVIVPVSNVVGEAGGGFAIAQSRLGPGRVHHAMRCVGMAEHGLALLGERARARSVFGSPLASTGAVRSWAAEGRMAVEQARLLVVETARALDGHDVARARTLTSMIKVVAPRVAATVLDRAVQVHGAAGLTDDLPLARLWSHARSLQFGDGPDEVHLEVVARAELGDGAAR